VINRCADVTFRASLDQYNRRLRCVLMRARRMPSGDYGEKPTDFCQRLPELVGSSTTARVAEADPVALTLTNIATPWAGAC
jgi:hypothetical protein